MCSSYILIPYEDSWPTALRVFLYLCGLLYLFLGLAIIMQNFMVAMDNIANQTRVVFAKDPRTGAMSRREDKIWNPTVADITLLALGTSIAQISLAIISSVQQLGSLDSGQGVGVATIAGGAASNLFPTLACCTLVPGKSIIKKIEKVDVFLVELFWSTWAYIWLYIVSEVWTPGIVTVLEAVLTVLQFVLLLAHAYAQDRKLPYLSFPFSYASGPKDDAHWGKPLELKGSRLSLLDDVGPLEGQRSRDSSSPGAESPSTPVASVLQVDCAACAPSSSFRECGQDVSRGKAALVEAQANSMQEPHIFAGERFSLAAGLRRRSLGKTDMLEVVPDTQLTCISENKENRSRSFSSCEIGSARASSPLPESTSGQPVSDPSAFRSEEDKGGKNGTSTATVERSSMSLGQRWRKQLMEAVVMQGLGAEDIEEPDPLDLSSSRFKDSGLWCWAHLKSGIAVAVHALCLFWKVVFAVLIPPPDLLHGWPAFLTSISMIVGMCSVVIELTTLFSCSSGLDSFIVSLTLLAAGTSIPNIVSSTIAAKQNSSADSSLANINASNAMNVYLGLGLPWVITTLYTNNVLKSSFSISLKGLGSSLIIYFITMFLGFSILLGRRMFGLGEFGGGCRTISSFGYMASWGLYILFSVLFFYGIL